MTNGTRSLELSFHHEETVILPADPATVFAFADDLRIPAQTVH
jgi:hypothetical protein